MDPKGFTIKVTLPQSDDDFGRWLEDNNVSVRFSCSLGSYSVYVSWKRLHSYSDAAGQHSENWEVSRHDKSFPKALNDALSEAARQMNAHKAALVKT